MSAKLLFFFFQAEDGIQDVEENIVWTNGPAFDLDLAERTACTGHRKGPDPARTDVHVLLGLPGLCVGFACHSGHQGRGHQSCAAEQKVPAARAIGTKSMGGITTSLAHTRFPIDKGCEVESWPCKTSGALAPDTLKRGQSSWAAPSAGQRGPFLGSRIAAAFAVPLRSRGRSQSAPFLIVRS